MKYPHWTDFDIDDVFYGVGAPLVGIGIYTANRKFSWPDSEGTTKREYELWAKHLKQNGYDVPEEYINHFVPQVPKMNNDADQKMKWREFWICCDAGLNNSGYGTIDLEPDADSESLHVIEAASALAEIEKLRAENAELKVFMDSNQMALNAMNEERTNMIKKLTAANVQMEIMVEALRYYKTNAMTLKRGYEVHSDIIDYCNGEIADEALTQYEKDGE